MIWKASHDTYVTKDLPPVLRYFVQSKFQSDINWCKLSKLKIMIQNKSMIATIIYKNYIYACSLQISHTKTDQEKCKSTM